MDITLSRRELHINWQKAVAIAALALVFIAIVWFVYSFLPVNIYYEPNVNVPIIGVDWKQGIYPAIINMFQGKSPYDASAVFNPPWYFLILSPLAIFPPEFGSAVVFAVSLFAYGFIAYKLGADLLVIALFVLSPPVWGNAIVGNGDWLALLGLIMPPWLGLFFVLSRPQVGIGIAVYWAFTAWREGGIYRAAKMVMPVAVCFAASILIYGPWPLLADRWIDASWNTSLGSQGIGIGLVLLFSAIRSKRKGLAISSSPFFAPYLTRHSWSAVALGMLPDRGLTIAVIAAYWIIWLINPYWFRFLFWIF